MIDAHIRFPTEEKPLENLEETLEFSGISGVIALQTQNTADRINCLQYANASEGLVCGLITEAPLGDDRQMRLQIDRDSRESQICGYLTDISNNRITDWAEDEDVIHSLRQMADNDISLDLLISTDQVTHLLSILDAHPNLAIMLDHCSGNTITIDEKWTRILREIGRRPHVFYRLSGLATGLEKGSIYELTENIKSYFDNLLEAFGTERILYGSGWPNFKVTYPAWLNTIDNLVAELPDSEREAIYSANALSFYKIDQE